MNTYCVMASPERLSAGLCLHLIPEARRRRGSHFCSNECHTEYRRGRAAERAERKCRLCGRRMPRKGQGARRQDRQPREAVNSVHTTPEAVSVSGQTDSQNDVGA